MRVSKILRKLDANGDPEAISVASLLMWGVFGLVIVIGLVLYFKYERLVVSLLG